ncbi:hypothetical protein FDW83_09310 [Pseudarthrobacter sp. NamE2]|uniref:hypothetical protein n=1 Tax=Pseudarthrobacter sp. NamE2 TaxID=2576838 RepID=UPI0010FF6151|nr:hypothetical protein [Pseudarthrobacter sp. NamE2]TLM83647.1 hypothetical protein FDW83_09310 [Pseudarthrobacter sp. NamE2]
MSEERHGEKWNIGDRIRYPHPNPDSRRTVEGTILDKTWGRESGTPIYHFTVKADGETETWVIGPNVIQPATGAPTPASVETAAAPDANAQPSDNLSHGSETAAPVEYPEPFPEKTGFGPLDADNQREWRKDKARWEKENRP